MNKNRVEFSIPLPKGGDECDITQRLLDRLAQPIEIFIPMEIGVRGSLGVDGKLTVHSYDLINPDYSDIPLTFTERPSILKQLKEKFDFFNSIREQHEMQTQQPTANDLVSLTIPKTRFVEFAARGHDPKKDGRRWGQAFHQYMDLEKVTIPSNKHWCDTLYNEPDTKKAISMVLGVLDHNN